MKTSATWSHADEDSATASFVTVLEVVGCTDKLATATCNINEQQGV
jgi:hypothetical protein